MDPDPFDDETSSDATFYDRAERRRSRYGGIPVELLQPELVGANAEALFDQEVEQRLTPADALLDVGTGDGAWLLDHAHGVDTAVGLDVSRRRLEAARDRVRWSDEENVDLTLAEMRSLPFRDGAFTVVTSRRGPLSEGKATIAEARRVLRPGGLALELAVGELDRHEITEVFRRGQWYGYRHSSNGLLLDEKSRRFREQGFRLLTAVQHVGWEFFPNHRSLMYSLETEPVVPGFDPERDARLVDEIEERYGTSRGIRTTYHRIIIVAQKEA